MKLMSRRDLFFKTLEAVKPREPVTPDCREIIVGRVVDFPPGARKLLFEKEVYIESLPEGLRAQSAQCENQYFLIRTNQFGELIVNLKEEWPAETVFSVMTNEPSGLDKSEEDRS